MNSLRESLKQKLPKTLLEISNYISQNGGQAILVGGYVRDYFLQLPSKDLDIEVYKISSLDILQKLLSNFGSLSLVGKSFGILKLQCDGYEYDFSYPRTEQKIAEGHKGFDVKIDATLDYKEASGRRDFRINSIGYDIQNNMFLDPYDGIRDIENKILRHIKDDTFIEDPLRVYRAVQFCARFDFKLHESTKKLCLQIVNDGRLEELPKERIFEEFKKLLLKSNKPSIGFKLMKELGILKYFPQLNINEKMLSSIDEMAKLKTGSSKRDLILMLAIICIDLEENSIFSFIDSLTNEYKIANKIVSLLKFDIPKLFINKQKEINNKAQLLILKFNIKENLPKPFIGGRDLIELGFEPGTLFKEIIDFVYKLQLDGQISSKDEAIKLIKETLDVP